MALYYEDYLEIKQDFVPVFSDEIDKREPKRWKYFVPHQCMRDVLTAVIKAMEGATAADRKPIWLTGSYGTGKTFAAFVIKHMLEDDLDSVKEYFDRYPLIKPLFNRLESIRQRGRILVVYRSGSSNIVSSERLLIEIQQSTQKALAEAGYTYRGGRTAVDSIVSKLTDPDTTFNFEKAFEKYRLEFGEYSNPQQVIDALQKADNYDLIERVAMVLEKEGFVYLEDVEDVKTWIDDVIERNGLTAIWFIWDEFTDYFRQNRAVSTLQELAHASAKMPFYLFLITHRKIDQFAMDEDARKVLRDRFVNVRFEMSDVTSYQLMANAINVKEERKQEWESKLVTLWGEVATCATELKVSSDGMEVVNEQDLKKLVPIHPYTTYLLSVISRRLSSNQRTMFQFLEENPAGEGDSTRYNFRWFIQTHSLEGWHWLTSDILWDYFFSDVATDNPDYPQEIHQVINYYNVSYQKIPSDNEGELRVFKSIMLLVALSRVVESARLLRPIESNLELMFAGTPLRICIGDILTSLHERGLINFNVVSSGDREVVIPLMLFDETKIGSLKAKLKQSYSFDKCAATDGLLGKVLVETIGLNGPLAARFAPMTTSRRNLKRSFDKLDFDLEPYQIGLLFVIPSSDHDVVSIEQDIEEVIAKESRIIVIVVEQSFTDIDLDNWLTAKAHESYCEELGDTGNAKYYEEQANSYVDKWLSKAKIASLSTFFMGEKIKVNKLDELDKYLEKMSRKVYPYGPESIVGFPHLYKSGFFGVAAAGMGMGHHPLKNPYTNIKDALDHDGFWDRNDMFEIKPDHPVSRMKKTVDEMMESGTSVYLADIWEELMKPPFGLAPSQVACFLFGFLMKDYANAGYYKDDGINPISLSAEGMADAIVSVMKPGRNTAPQIAITKITREHQEFCRQVSSIFGIEGDVPRSVRQNLRYRLNDIKYPLWTLKYYVSHSSRWDADENLKSTLSKLVDKLCEFTISDDKDDMLALVDDMVKLLHSHPMAAVYFEELGDISAFKDGMEVYLEEKHANILQLASNLNVSTAELIDRIRGIMAHDASWLWQEEKLDYEIKVLENEFKLLNALSGLTGNVKSNLNEFIVDIRRWLSKFKLPPEAIAGCLDGDAAQVFNSLNSLVYSDDYDSKNMGELACLIEEYGQYIKHKLSDPYNIFREYLMNQKGIDITEDGFRELYSKLPEESCRDEEVFMQQVNDMISEMEIIRLMGELEDLWQNISGSLSPRQWSQETNIPILCLPGMENVGLVKALEIINERNEHGKHAIEEAIAALENSENVLSVLANRSAAEREFIQAVAGEYSYLVFNGVGKESFVAALTEQFGTDVYSWGKVKSEIQKFTRKYLTDYYKQEIYEVVLEKIDVLSAESAKDYLKELIESEPLVGIRILMSANEGAGTN